jgi:predicted amidophosphoribosyltransferase
MSTSLSGAAKDAAAFKQRLMGEGGKKCPDCAENVQADAKVCRFCGHHFEVVEAPAELA